MQIEIQLDAPPGAAAERARTLLASGVDGLFTFEGQHDVFLPLIEAALAHPDGVPADLTTNVAIALPRSPMHLAHTAHDLQTLSRGRFRLGLGSQIRPHIENRYGSTWDRPAARMREWVAAVRAILAAWQDGTRLDFRGEFTRHTLMAPTFNPGPNAYGLPPVLMGALGPVMTRTAAEVADGLLVMPFNSADHFRERTLPAIEAGLDRGDRTWDDLEVVPQVICAVGRTPEEVERATLGVRGLVAFYGSTPAYRPVLEVAGREELQPELNRLSKTGDFAAMIELVDDDLLDTIAVRGTPEQVAAEIHRRFGTYADRVCVYFPGSDVSGDLLTALVDAVHARD